MSEVQVQDLPDELVTQILAASGVKGIGALCSSLACSSWHGASVARYLTTRFGEAALAAAVRAGDTEATLELLEQDHGGSTVEALDSALDGLGGVNFVIARALAVALIRKVFDLTPQDLDEIISVGESPSGGQREHDGETEQALRWTRGSSTYCVPSKRVPELFRSDVAGWVESFRAMIELKFMRTVSHSLELPSTPGRVLERLDRISIALPVLRRRPCNAVLSIAMQHEASMHRYPREHAEASDQEIADAHRSVRVACEIVRKLVPHVEGSLSTLSMHLRVALLAGRDEVLFAFRSILELAAEKHRDTLWTAFVVRTGAIGGTFNRMFDKHAVEVARALLRPLVRSEPTTMHVVADMVRIACKYGCWRFATAIFKDDALFLDDTHPVSDEVIAYRRREVHRVLEKRGGHGSALAAFFRATL